MTFCGHIANKHTVPYKTLGSQGLGAETEPLPQLQGGSG